MYRDKQAESVTVLVGVIDSYQGKERTDVAVRVGKNMWEAHMISLGDS